VVAKTMSYPLLIARRIETDLPYALPPFHTLALLDHPLHWRRVLERESVSVLRWVTVDQGRDPGRDTRVSVLGFPLTITPISHGNSGLKKKAYDRDELANHIASLRDEAETMLISRAPEEGFVDVYDGFKPHEQIFRSDFSLTPDMGRLSRSLVSHIAEVMELRGPIKIRLVWEQNRLFLESIEPVLDIFENSNAHRALGTGYDRFLHGIIEAHIRQK